MPKQNIIGPHVRKLRVESGLSQDALAAKCQRIGWALTRGTLAKIEARVRLVNDAEVLLLAHTLKVSPERLFPTGKRGKIDAGVIEAARHSFDWVKAVCVAFSDPYARLRALGETTYLPTFYEFAGDHDHSVIRGAAPA